MRLSSRMQGGRRVDEKMGEESKVSRSLMSVMASKAVVSTDEEDAVF